MNPHDIRTIKRLADIEAATAFPISQIELSRACYMNTVSAGQYLRALIADGRMHRAAWREIGPGRRVALYVWGAGRNARKPKALSGVVIERNRMKRIKADPDAHARFLSSCRARYAIKKAVKRPASWLSALGVVAA